MNMNNDFYSYLVRVLLSFVEMMFIISMRPSADFIIVRLIYKFQFIIVNYSARTWMKSFN